MQAYIHAHRQARLSTEKADGMSTLTAFTGAAQVYSIPQLISSLPEAVQGAVRAAVPKSWGQEIAISDLSVPSLVGSNLNITQVLAGGLLPLLSGASLVAVPLSSELKVLVQTQVSDTPRVVCNISFSVRRGEFLGVASASLPNISVTARAPEQQLADPDATALQEQLEYAEYSAGATTAAVAVSVAVAVANSGVECFH